VITDDDAKSAIRVRANSSTEESTTQFEKLFNHYKKVWKRQASKQANKQTKQDETEQKKQSNKYTVNSKF